MLDKAVDAALAVASSFGLSGIAPQVLRDGSNVVLRLTPYPVVARVATETARLRPGVAAWLERDIEVARHLDAAGIPVARPSDDPPAGPHEHDGVILAFWEFVPHHDGAVDPTRLAAMLADLHEALRDLDLTAARGPIGDLRTCLELVDPPSRIWTDAARLSAELVALPRRPVHGDAHPGNVLITGNGLVWNDFEDAWQGPLAWDLACMAESSRFDGHAAVAAYPGPVDQDAVAVCCQYRRLFGVVWRMFRAQTTPSWQADADAHLARWLER